MEMQYRNHVNATRKDFHFTSRIKSDMSNFESLVEKMTQSESREIQEQSEAPRVNPVPSRSWHPHVFSSPPKSLTSHSIEDILYKSPGDRTVYQELGEHPLNLTVREKEENIKRKIGEDCENKRKKMRTTFTGRQIFELEKMFEIKKYLNSSERRDMSR